MAQIFRLDFEQSDSILAIWKIDEPLECLLEKSLDWQREHCQRLGSENRKCEWLSWQMLLREILGDVVTDYRPSGAPYIIDSKRFLSVSHCRNYAAVLISSSPCAVDIEPKDRDFSKAASRFLTDKESTFADNLGTVWGTKETVFKLLENDNIEMLKDIIVEDIADEKIRARVGDKIFNLTYLGVNQLNVVYLLKNKQSL